MKRLLTTLACVTLLTPLFASIQLSPLFSSGMVLQQQKPIAVWGYATAGASININFLQHNYTTQVTSSGYWELYLPPQNAGGPYTMLITDGNDNIRLNDILIGEIWVASGQSNMWWPIKSSADADTYIKGEASPLIRLFQIPQVSSSVPLQELENGQWTYPTSEAIAEFSAVAYHFATMLAEQLKVPIGIIHGSWGATSAEAWTSLPTLRSTNDYTSELNALPLTREAWNRRVDSSNRLEHQRNEIKRTAAEGVKQQVHQPAYNDEEWMQTVYPLTAGTFFDFPYFGFIWFRNEIQVDKILQGKKLYMKFPHLQGEQVDIYLDGKLIQEKANISGEHSVELPVTKLTKGKHLIAIRIFNEWGQHTIGKAYLPAPYITDQQEKNKLSFNQHWKYSPSIEPVVAQWQNWYTTPSVLYNGMIHPLRHYSIRGFIWYQGESNAWQGYGYTNVINRMIHDWRNQFQQGELAFLSVQLAGYMAATEQPNEGGWAKLRDAQLKMLHTPNTGLAVIIDAGEAEDIHPGDKKTVGTRLALWALANTYQQQRVFTGPLYDHYTIEGEYIRIHFKPSSSKLQLRSSDKKSFIIAGEDHTFIWADEVKIDGNTLLVRAADISKPAAVRYAWANNPAVLLYNEQQLPASPFRTDNWED